MKTRPSGLRLQQTQIEYVDAVLRAQPRVTRAKGALWLAGALLRPLRSGMCWLLGLEAGRHIGLGRIGRGCSQGTPC